MFVIFLILICIGFISMFAGLIDEFLYEEFKIKYLACGIPCFSLAIYLMN